MLGFFGFNLNIVVKIMKKYDILFNLLVLFLVDFRVDMWEITDNPYFVI